MLEEIFSAYGDIGNIYFPVDLRHLCKPKGFAFVRFTRESDARRAASEMNNTNLGIGRNILVHYLPPQPSYFSQNETDITKQKKRPL